METNDKEWKLKNSRHIAYFIVCLPVCANEWKTFWMVAVIGEVCRAKWLNKFIYTREIRPLRRTAFDTFDNFEQQKSIPKNYKWKFINFV